MVGAGSRRALGIRKENKMSLAAILFVLFLAFKLAGIIAWSWLWVTAPLWGPAGLALVIYLGMLAFGMSVHRTIRKRLF